MKFKSKEISCWFYGVSTFTFFTLLFPKFFLNKLIFVLLFGLIVYKLKSYIKITITPVFLAIIFFFGYCNSFFNIVDQHRSITLFLSISVLFLIYPITQYKIDFDKICKLAGLLIVFYTFLIFVYFSFKTGSLKNDFLTNILEKISIETNGFRYFRNIKIYSTRIGTTSFLYIPFLLFFISYLKTKKINDLIFTLLTAVCILLSASRGLLLFSVLGVIIVLMFKWKSTLNKRIIYFFISLFCGVLIYLYNKTTLLSIYEPSNYVKLGHIYSFFYNFNLKNFFIGDGLGAFYYSSGRRQFLAVTEISPFDMIRYLGVFMTGIIYYYIINPVKNIQFKGDNLLYLLLFLLYIALSFTNPVMFNPSGMLVIVWYWNKVINYSTVNDKNSNSELIFMDVNSTVAK